MAGGFHDGGIPGMPTCNNAIFVEIMVIGWGLLVPGSCLLCG
jgi:hypothetical protein